MQVIFGLITAKSFTLLDMEPGCGLDHPAWLAGEKHQLVSNGGGPAAAQDGRHESQRPQAGYLPISAYRLQQAPE